LSATLDAVLHRAPHEDRVAAVAGGLHACGAGRGDAVVWQLPNSVDADVLYRACWRLGAVAVPIHHLAGPSEAELIVSSVTPAVVIDGSSLPTAAPVTRAAAEPDDIAVILHTSGSSGAPKGVRHTQAALAYKALLMAEVHGLTPDDAVLMPAPLAHISGLLNGVLLPGVVPMKSVLMAKWDPDEAITLIEREQITFMIGPPTFFISLMDAPSFTSDRVRSLRLVSSGGAGVTPAFVERASAALDCTVKRTYGSTEAPTVTTSRPGDDPAKARDTDGRPVGDVELRIDPANGELLVRGSELFTSYTDAAHTVAAFTDDGWFRTGDIGAIDDQGWLTIVGRIKDVIIRGGENISAAEIEGVLEAHPAVRQAVAIGAPDERLGERVVAVVVAPDGFDLGMCADWFRSRGIARFKTPERVVVVPELPVLGSGKPDRAALRERFSRAE
jgi:cyclohexanecarboxylate-CoA ligase